MIHVVFHLLIIGYLIIFACSLYFQSILDIGINLRFGCETNGLDLYPNAKSGASEEKPKSKN